MSREQTLRLAQLVDAGRVSMTQSRKRVRPVVVLRGDVAEAHRLYGGRLHRSELRLVDNAAVQVTKRVVRFLKKRYREAELVIRFSGIDPSDFSRTSKLCREYKALRVEEKDTVLEAAPVDLAYAAAIMDGEGNFGIGRQRSKSGGIHHQLKLRVSMCDPKVPQWMHEKFGGSLRWTEREGFRHPIWIWDISANGAFRFVEAIRPYLKTKAGHADLALQFRDLRGTGQSPVPPELVEARDRIRHAISALNLGVRRAAA